MNLKQLRLQAKKTQPELCTELNIPLRSYQEYESGRSQMRYNTLIQLADYFGCSVDYLLGHKTKGIVHLDSYTPLQQEVISKLRLLDEDQLFVLSNYIDTINGKPLSEILENAKKK